VASIDALDFAVYRALSPGGVARFWASRRLIDPRITAQQVADAVGLSEAGVRGRLRSLRERGYLRGSEVWLNPGLFDAAVDSLEVPVDDSSAARQLLKDLALVEGVIFARDILDEEDRKVRVHFVHSGPGAEARRVSLIRRLAGRKGFRGPQPYYVPPLHRRLSPLDWRIVRALRDAPDAPLAEVAANVHITLKTLGRRLRSLLDEHAIWWTHDRETLEAPLAMVSAKLRPPTKAGDLAGTLGPGLPPWMPVPADGFGLPPEDGASYEVGLMLTVSPAEVERAIQAMLDRPSVLSVRRTFTLGFGIYPDWFDEQIRRQL
jgi:DNA-binding Lrp family transcriptional regulator